VTGISAGQLSEAIRAATVDGISTLYLVKRGTVRYTLALACAIQKPVQEVPDRSVIKYSMDPVALIKVSPVTSDAMPWQGWPGRIVVDHGVHVYGALALATKHAQGRFPVIAEQKK